MEKGDGGNKKKEEIFHVGQIEKQNERVCVTVLTVFART